MVNTTEEKKPTKKYKKRVPEHMMPHCVVCDKPPIEPIKLNSSCVTDKSRMPVKKKLRELLEANLADVLLPEFLPKTFYICEPCLGLVQTVDDLEYQLALSKCALLKMCKESYAKKNHGVMCVEVQTHYHDRLTEEDKERVVRQIVEEYGPIERAMIDAQVGWNDHEMVEMTCIEEEKVRKRRGRPPISRKNTEDGIELQPKKMKISVQYPVVGDDGDMGSLGDDRSDGIPDVTPIMVEDQVVAVVIDAPDQSAIEITGTDDIDLDDIPDGDDDDLLPKAARNHLHEFILPNDVPDQCLECAICNGIFGKRITLYRHIRQKHAEEWKEKVQYIRECHYCTETFGSLMKLVSHVREVHNPLNLFCCKLCGVLCEDRKMFMAHRNIHRKWQCSYCERKFVERATMLSHEKTHTRERPYICHECGKTFRFRQSLKMHQQRHDNVVFPCPVCGHKYLKKENLKFHMKKHHAPGDLQVNVQCSLCDGIFVSQKELSRHVLRVHKEQMYVT